MSRFLSAYDTTACSGFVIKPIVESLIKTFITGDFHLDEKTGIYLITGIDGSNNVRTFNHPITLKYEGNNKTFVDVRSAIKLEPHTNNYFIRDTNEFNFMLKRAHLNGLWNEEMPNLLRDVSKLPLAAYANIICDFVTKRLALDPRDSLALLILSAVFYLNLFNDDDVVVNAKTDALYMSGVIANTLSIKQTIVYDQIKDYTVIKNINDFCKVCQEATQSVRMRDLNSTTLVDIMGGAWYGTNGRELMAVSLEHPPTWLMLLERALSDRSYVNSGLGRALERGIFKRLSENYKAQINLLTQRTL